MKRHVAIRVATLSVSTGAFADYLGKVTAVIDGDTFTMEAESGKVRVRICGIDAPERGQPGYGQAAGVLSNLIEGKLIHCLQVGEGTPCDGKSKPTSRDRIVAQCFLDKLDIAGEMTKSGTACDWPKFSGGHYKRRHLRPEMTPIAAWKFQPTEQVEKLQTPRFGIPAPC